MRARPCVSCCGLNPSASATQMSVVSPECIEPNTSRRPSEDGSQLPSVTPLREAPTLLGREESSARQFARRAPAVDVLFITDRAAGASSESVGFGWVEPHDYHRDVVATPASFACASSCLRGSFWCGLRLKRGRDRARCRPSPSIRPNTATSDRQPERQTRGLRP